MFVNNLNKKLTNTIIIINQFLVIDKNEKILTIVEVNSSFDL